VKLRKTHLAATVVLLAVLLAAASASAANQARAYHDGVKAFRELSSSSRAKYRDAWMRVHSLFQEALNKNPGSVTGAKCIYYMARTWEELGKRSYLKKDFHRAADNYQRAANRFPAGHSWIDDSLFRKARIRAKKIGDEEGARKDLTTLLERHPDGDMAGEARDLLAELGGKAPERTASRRLSSSAAPAKNLEANYRRALGRFQALRKSPRAHQREDFLDVAGDFKALYRADPGGEYGAKARYFMGFTYAELGEVSGREGDFEKAAENYRLAADSFGKGHSWTDDALYRRAVIMRERLGRIDGAYADLLEIVHEHGKGDMAGEAKDLLEEMDREQAEQLAGSRAPEPEPEAEPARVPSPGGMAELANIRYRTSGDYTRIVLDLTAAAGYEHRLLPPDPAHKKSHRMFVDLSDTRLGPGIDREISIRDGLLRRVRSGQNTPDTARVVLDFTERKKYHVFALENPYRIVIDVYAQDGEQAVAQQAPGKGYEIPDRPTTAQEKQEAADVLNQLGLTVSTVMIDPGHGGRDPGAVHYKTGGGKRRIDLLEKDITLRLAGILGEKLREKGFRVLYTRKDDRYISLEDRAVTANLKKADLFISLHANANRSSKVSGFETYYLGKARSDVVLRLAAKENGVSPAKIGDTQKIVLDLVHSFKIEESKGLARLIQDRTVKELRRHYQGVRDNGARSAPMFVLIGAKMPAILVEVGYTTNPTELSRLKTEAYLKRVADGLVSGIEAYKQRIRTAGL
jgi:N-acetylmuramoyl-L-alanine amidase